MSEANADTSALFRRAHGELMDSFDEELEMEVDDERLAKLFGALTDHPAPETIDRQVYFKELFRLQGELVKLQDWIVHRKLKVVVMFEGRDAAGKGGAIKRITQRLNPRVARVAALPAPSSREKTQWYFQRYVAHLPAAGEMVLFDRSWYNRAGVERVMGFCTDAEYEEFFRSVPEFEKMLVRSGIQVIKYWFSIPGRGAGVPVPLPHQRPAQAMEAQPDGPRVAQALGTLHQGQGSDARAHAHPRGAVVGGAGRGQETRPARLSTREVQGQEATP